MQHSTLFCFSALQPVTRWEVPLCRKSHSAHIVCSCHVGHSCQCQTMQVLQNGPRGRREREFYERVRSELRTEKAARLRLAAQASVSEDVSDEDDQASVSGRSDYESDAQTKLPFSVRNAAMLATVPRFCEYLSPACCMVAVFRSRGLSLSTWAWILFESSRADIAGHCSNTDASSFDTQQWQSLAYAKGLLLDDVPQAQPVFCFLAATSGCNLTVCLL